MGFVNRLTRVMVFLSINEDHYFSLFFAYCSNLFHLSILHKMDKKHVL